MTAKKAKSASAKLVRIAGPDGQFGSAPDTAPDEQTKLHLSAADQEALGFPEAVEVTITAAEAPEPEPEPEPAPAEEPEAAKK